jgi:hypothetical protein
VWQFALWSWWGVLPAAAGGHIISAVPFHGLATFSRVYGQWLTEFSDLSLRAALSLVLIGYLGWFGIAVGANYRKSLADGSIKVAWLLAAVLLMHAGPSVWEHPYSFSRVLSEFFVLGTIVMLGRPRSARRRLYFYALPLWCAMFILASAG